MDQQGEALAADETRPLLQVQRVSKSFPGVKALSDMHLDLRRGEVMALVGENGAGKSTLMKLLSGIYPADEGAFFLNGDPFEASGPKHAQDLGISIIHQEFNLMPDLTVAQNIYIGHEPRGGGFLLNERRLNAQAQSLIAGLHLPLEPKQLVGNLTVAKQQMVEIAKALAYDAKVLIMDEPTAALNDAEVEVLHGLIRRFVTADTGVIYISHRIAEL
jgi:ribose transport system ATP-binding protein